MAEYEGTCQCGSVQFIVTGEVEAFICHCDDCRLNSGAPCTAWGKVHHESLQLLSGELKDFNSSAAVTWSFCETCGTAVRYRSDESFPSIDFMLCTLKDPSVIKPAYHVQMQEKLEWLKIDDGLPAFEKWRPENLQ